MQQLTSVVIPAFNRPEMLFKATESVLKQEGSPFELIVVDDGSTEDLTKTENMLRAAGHKFLKTANRGVAAARNYALSEAKGEWLCLLDSDDCWLPGKLEKQLQYHKTHPEFLVSQTEEIWCRNGKKINKKKIHAQPQGDIFKDSCKICCLSSSSVIFKREVWESCGPYDEALTVCEDYDFWLRVTAKYKTGLVPGELAIKYGGHEDQLSKAISGMDRYRVYALLKTLRDIDLSKDQKTILTEELLKKVEILKTGALKRGYAGISVYSYLIESIESSVVDDFIKSLQCTDIMENLKEML